MLDQLDAEQRAAATSTARLIRVRAGAGTGKTMCLTARIAWLVAEAGVPPAQIAAITFSKKAAGELTARLEPAIVERAQVSTIHSLCYLILRKEAPGRKVCEEGVKKRLIRQAMKDTGCEEKFAVVVSAISRHKGAGRSLPPHLEAVLARYESLLVQHRYLDFDDLLLHSEWLLRERPAIRARWAGRWTHVLVDEVQDTNPLQWRVLRQLVTEATALFIVGDCSQGIYRFRGADSGLMLEPVEEMFGPFTDYPLATNYRSQPPVVELANRLIDGRPGAVTLRAHRPLQETVPVVRFFPLPVLRPEDGGMRQHDRWTEARDLVAALEGLHRDGWRWGDMACLYRTNAQSEALEAACLKAKVPAIVTGGVGFYGRREILDVLAYVKLSLSWDLESLERVFNRPSRYLGEAFAQELQRGGGWEAAVAGRLPAFSRAYMGKRLGEFLRDVRRLQVKAEDEATPAELVRYVLEQVGEEGYRAWLLGEEPTLEDEVRGENLDTLLETAREHTTVAGLLDFAARCEQRQRQPTADDEGRVVLSTVHRFKGLEAPVVAVVGLAEGLLPHRLAMTPEDVEEERRIAYVAITRARDVLLLSTPGEPSRFWHELGGPSESGPENEEDDDVVTPWPTEGEWDEVSRETDVLLAEEEAHDAAAALAEAGPCGAGDGNGGRAAPDVAGDAARGGGEPAQRGARDRGADDGLGPARRGDPGDGAGGAVDVAAAAAGGGAAGAGGAPWQCAWCRWPNEPEAVNCSQCEMPKAATSAARPVARGG